MQAVIDRSEVDDLVGDMGHHLEAFPGEASTIVAVGGHRLVSRAQVLSPVDTGTNRNSIGLDMEPGSLGFEAGPTTSYGRALELGVPHPYVIRARPGGFLRFTGRDGRTVFVRQVVHPASPPRPYMRPAFDTTVPEIVDNLTRVATSRVLGGGR